MIPRENPHQIVLERIWMFYLCWDAEWCQVSPSPLQNMAKKNLPKCQAAILREYVLSLRVALPGVANSRWSGGEGMSTETINFCKKACTKCTVVLTHLAFNSQTKQALFCRWSRALLEAQSFQSLLSPTSQKCLHTRHKLNLPHSKLNSVPRLSWDHVFHILFFFQSVSIKCSF